MYFIQILEFLYAASYESKNEKLPTIAAAVRRIDGLKFLLRVAWELQALDDKKYALLSEKTDELGRMVGGWKRGLEAKTPARLAWEKEERSRQRPDCRRSTRSGSRTNSPRR